MPGGLGIICAVYQDVYLQNVTERSDPGYILRLKPMSIWLHQRLEKGADSRCAEVFPFHRVFMEM